MLVQFLFPNHFRILRLYLRNNALVSDHDFDKNHQYAKDFNLCDLFPLFAGLF